MVAAATLIPPTAVLTSVVIFQLYSASGKVCSPADAFQYLFYFLKN